jgi:uncharacterized coiled-coil protein SlyX
MSFFKKALGVFVELDTSADSAPSVSSSRPSSPASSPIGFTQLDQASAEKFEKHFEQLFDKANLPGPDYFEFWKTMETLEKLIPDEGSRLAATYASLSVQGLTKAKLLDTAAAYMDVIAKDRAAFEQAAAAKAAAAVDGRKHTVVELEQRIAANSEQIRKLNAEITEMQGKISGLKKELVDEEMKLNTNRTGYQLACDAMTSKIKGDIEKIRTQLQ